MTNFIFLKVIQSRAQNPSYKVSATGQQIVINVDKVAWEYTERH